MSRIHEFGFYSVRGIDGTNEDAIAKMLSDTTALMGLPDRAIGEGHVLVCHREDDRDAHDDRIVERVTDSSAGCAEIHLSVNTHPVMMVMLAGLAMVRKAINDKNTQAFESLFKVPVSGSEMAESLTSRWKASEVGLKSVVKSIATCVAAAGDSATHDQGFAADIERTILQTIESPASNDVSGGGSNPRQLVNQVMRDISDKTGTPLNQDVKANFALLQSLLSVRNDALASVNAIKGTKLDDGHHFMRTNKYFDRINNLVSVTGESRIGFVAPGLAIVAYVTKIDSDDSVIQSIRRGYGDFELVSALRMPRMDILPTRDELNEMHKGVEQFLERMVFQDANMARKTVRHKLS